MKLYEVNVFGQILYSKNLSYEQVNEREILIKKDLEESFSNIGAKFFSFEAFGDGLYFQCVLTKNLSDDILKVLDFLVNHCVKGVSMRILFVPKNFEHVSVCNLQDNSWKMEDRTLLLSKD